MHRIQVSLLSVVLAGTAAYFVLYLYGWQWYRAFVVGVVFVAAEVALVALHLSALVRRSTAQKSPDSSASTTRTHTGRAEDVVVGVLNQVPPTYPSPFRWLRPTQTSIFIPLLLGAGVLMSGVAWVMERLAGALYGGTIDASLARLAAPLIPPDDLLDAPTSIGLLASPGQWDRVVFERREQSDGPVDR